MEDVGSEGQVRFQVSTDNKRYSGSVVASEMRHLRPLIAEIVLLLRYGRMLTLRQHAQH